jgi:hypothetical protein
MPELGLQPLVLPMLHLIDEIYTARERFVGRLRSAQAEAVPPLTPRLDRADGL